MITLVELREFDHWKEWKNGDTPVVDSIEIFDWLETRGVYINYSVEHYKDGSNLNFSIEFILNRDNLSTVGTGWYGDNHEFGNTGDTVKASIKLAMWYLAEPTRIQLINSGYHNPEYISYIEELQEFTKTLTKN